MLYLKLLKEDSDFFFNQTPINNTRMAFAWQNPDFSLKFIDIPAPVLLCGYHGNVFSETNTNDTLHNYPKTASYTHCFIA